MWSSDSMSRRTERENAFIVIFESLFNDVTVEDIIESAKETLDWEDNDYVLSTSNGVIDNAAEFDELINNNLKNGWTVNRLSKVTLALLRLAIYEMKYVSDVPASVAINEAVELCKKYATDADASLLNGVLGSISKELE